MDDEKRTKRLEYYKQWNAANRQRRYEVRKVWAEANKERLREAAKARAKRPENVVKRKAYEREYRELNRDRLNAREKTRAKRRRSEQPGADSHFARSYQDAIRRATPEWLTPSEVAEMEVLKVQAKLATSVFGVRMCVDHTVPLRSKKVCGLHVPWNVTITTFSLNSRKSNKSWPDMWESENEL